MLTKRTNTEFPGECFDARRECETGRGALHTIGLDPPALRKSREIEGSRAGTRKNFAR